ATLRRAGRNFRLQCSKRWFQCLLTRRTAISTARANGKGADRSDNPAELRECRLSAAPAQFPETEHPLDGVVDAERRGIDDLRVFGGSQRSDGPGGIPAVALFQILQKTREV